VPTDATNVLAAENVPTAVPVEAAVTKKAFAVGASAYKSVETRDDASVGHAAGDTPEPATAVGAGAEKKRIWPATSVPTAAETTPRVIPVTGTAVGKVDTRKLPAAGAAAYRAVPTIVAALAGHAVVPPPVSVVALENCAKNSSVPAARVPTLADIAWVVVEIAEMGTLDTLGPDTQ
jgi:hypothetical protein